MLYLIPFKGTVIKKQFVWRVKLAHRDQIFLLSTFSHFRTEIESTRKELETQQLLQIAASDKLMDCERRLYNAEMETDRTRAVNMKLMVTIDELKLKIGKGEIHDVFIVNCTH